MGVFLMESKRSLARKYEKAFRSVAADVAIEVRNNIKERQHWAGFENSKTRRRGYRNKGIQGKPYTVEGANRNLVDTGDLERSMKFKINGSMYFTTADISFDASHYRHVRYGTKKVAGRDFVGRGLARATSHQDIDQAVLNKLKRI